MQHESIVNESLTCMYVSDHPKIDDVALALRVVALANTEGGSLYLGVEPDGRISGLNKRRAGTENIPQHIARHTHPAVAVRVIPLDLQNHRVLELEVPRSTHLVANSDGTVHQRRKNLQGSFENVPLLPYEFASRLASSQMRDVTAQAIPDAALDELSDRERARIRQVAAQFGGDPVLQRLSNEELDSALQLTTEHQGRRVPTVTGLLLAGTEDALARHLPAHEVSFAERSEFQVVRNEFSRAPLLKIVALLEQFYGELVTETEYHHDLHLVKIPSLDRSTFLESALNALCHRDYARLGAIHITWDINSVTISSPGGFISGVSADNFFQVSALLTEPGAGWCTQADWFDRATWPWNGSHVPGSAPLR